MRISVIAILMTLVVLPAKADELSDMYNAKIERHVSANPQAIKRCETPADVVHVWQDMVIVSEMISLLKDEKLPLKMKPEITRRISAAMNSTPKVGGWDDQKVQMLSEIVSLYAYSAYSHMKGESSWGAYNYPRMFFSGGSSVALARELEAKYAKPGQIIPLEKPMTKW